MQILKKLLENRRLLFATSGMSVLEAATYMDIHNIGALPVLKDGKLAGIFSERDIIRRCIVKKLDLEQTRIDDVMTKKVIVVESHDTTSYCLKIMKQENIRHLPVREDTELIGMISVRDLLVNELHEKEEKIEILNAYIQYSG
jgi:CBS domain-containing protein